jgi:hypothetical protein
MFLFQLANQLATVTPGDMDRLALAHHARAHLPWLPHFVTSGRAYPQISPMPEGTRFTQLCQSLGASMIHDPEQLSLEGKVDGSSVSADTSVSLGLIVTELVINALKHAFPGDSSAR